MPRKSFTVTPDMRTKVKSMAAAGLPLDHIAKMVGCPLETLIKKFRHELKLGPAEANAMVEGQLFQEAKSGNLSAIIFWLKAHSWVPPARKKTAEKGADSYPLLIVPRSRNMKDVALVLPVLDEAVARYEKKQARLACAARCGKGKAAKSTVEASEHDNGPPD